MGWFSRFVTKVVKVVAEPIETFIIEPIVANVIEPVVTTTSSFFSSGISWGFNTFVNPVIEVVETISTTVSNAVATLTDAGSNIAAKLADIVVDLGLEVGYKVLATYVDKYHDVSDTDFSRFEPVVDASEQIKNTETLLRDWSDDEVIMARDTIAITQGGFADYSKLRDAEVAILDDQGYVLDGQQAALYEETDWNPGIEDWLQDRFEIIRVQEARIPLVYEANVSLFRDLETKEYFISIGGTDLSGVEDLFTDGILLGAGETLSQFAISDIIEDFFAHDIEEGFDVNLAGASLGGAEALLQYQASPDLFDEVFLLVPAGIGGLDGAHYERNLWDENGRIGDSNITEINARTPTADINDFITSLGHVGAGQTFIIDEVQASQYSDDPDAPFVSHLNTNLWASLPGGDHPDLPTGTDDAFIFV